MTGTVAGGLDAVLDLLVCPHCRLELTRPEPGVLACATGHRFDVARQGYVALLGAGARTDHGDSADMVAARVELLTSGAFAEVSGAVVRALAEPPPVARELAPGGVQLAQRAVLRAVHAHRVGQRYRPGSHSGSSPALVPRERMKSRSERRLR